jgi:hypothetical protein
MKIPFDDGWKDSPAALTARVNAGWAVYFQVKET